MSLFFLHLLSIEDQKQYISSIAEELTANGKAHVGYGSGRDICERLKEWQGIIAIHYGNQVDGNTIELINNEATKKLLRPDPLPAS